MFLYVLIEILFVASVFQIVLTTYYLFLFIFSYFWNAHSVLRLSILAHFCKDICGIEHDVLILRRKLYRVKVSNA